jgi:hypothetical protein
MHERRSLSLAPASTPHRPESREQLKDVLGNAPGRELTTRDLWSWTHPREVRCPDRFRRKNISRAIRAAAEWMCVRVGRRWPDGTVWKMPDPST